MKKLIRLTYLLPMLVLMFHCYIQAEFFGSFFLIQFWYHCKLLEETLKKKKKRMAQKFSDPARSLCKIELPNWMRPESILSSTCL